MTQRWTVTRPDGTRWTRTFATEAAAWRVLAPGLTSVSAKVWATDLAFRAMMAG